MSSPDLSVVICTYNRAESLETALASVLEQEIPGRSFEVVVVNDGSTDETDEVVARLAAQTSVSVRLVHPDGKRGIAYARNAGIRAIAAPSAVFFDDDQLADPGWLEEMLRIAAEKQTEMVGGPRRLDLPDAALQQLGPVCRGLLGENLYPAEPMRLEGKELPTTGNLYFTRALFDKLNGFDAYLLASGEDADFVRRARALGVEIWTAPTAMVAHMVPDYRTTPAYFRWVSLRWGVQFATMDKKEFGKPRMLLNACLRACQAALIHVPKLVLAMVQGDASKIIDARALLWRAEGYVRNSLRHLHPEILAQSQFFGPLDFRHEREMFAEQEAGSPRHAAEES